MSVGSTGPDVALAQQKLNAFAGAAAPLQIDGVFTIVMTAFVSAFQAGQHITVNGTVDAATWTKLDTASPGGGVRMEGGAPVEQHVATRAGATSLAAPMAGTTLHMAVGTGGVMRGPGVREFQQKLNVWRASNGMAALTDDGKWGNDTRTATVAFQTATPGLSPATGIGDQPTWAALDAIAPAVAVGMEERQWLEEVGGHTYGLTNAGRRQRLPVRVGDPGQRHPRDREGPLCGRGPAGRMVRACQPAVESLQGRSRGHEPVDADHHGDGRGLRARRQPGPGGPAADDRPGECGHVVRLGRPGVGNGAA